MSYIYIYGAPILDVSRSHTTTQHSRQDSSGRVIISSQRPLPDNTQHSQQTNIHAPGRIRTHNFSRRAAADLRFRPRGHWDWFTLYQTPKNLINSTKIAIANKSNDFFFNPVKPQWFAPPALELRSMKFAHTMYLQVIHPRCVRCIQIRSKDSQVKTQLVL